jgi:hypothetical protein
MALGLVENGRKSTFVEFTPTEKKGPQTVTPFDSRKTTRAILPNASEADAPNAGALLPSHARHDS